MRGLAMLNATLDPSPRIRELALLGANAGSMRIYDYVSPTETAPTGPEPGSPTSGMESAAR